MGNFARWSIHLRIGRIATTCHPGGRAHMHSVLDCRFVVFVTHWAKPITYKGMTVSPVRNRPHRPRVLAVQEAVPRHRILDFLVFSICDPCGPTDDIYRFCMPGQKTNESGLQATMDAVAPFWGNTMQFMQFPNLHLYSPICALRIGATFFHVLPWMANPSSDRPGHSGS